MKFVIAAAIALFSFQASAEFADVTEANVRAALNGSPALVGALNEIKKVVSPSTCRKIEIKDLKQTGQGSATFTAHGLCFTSKAADGSEGASYFTLEGVMWDQKTLFVEKIEFGVAG